ncbi:MAG: hypothetical protein KDD44_03700, partial [Bdellovibrionales bacterium]|nr:hypothetical protein [Bdellovibrionales bacterium]
RLLSTTPSERHLVEFAEQLAQDRDSLPQALAIVRALLRNALRKAETTAARQARADLLERFLEAEQRIRERNFSPELQLSTVFLSLASTR